MKTLEHKFDGRRPMMNPLVISLALAILALTAALVPSCRAAQDKNAPTPNATEQSTSLEDQTDLAVTVYNSNIALIRDVRQVQLPTGTVHLKFMDIAATVNPATVHFRSMTDPDKVSVIEQNYEYDLLEPSQLLNKYVGKEVTLLRTYMDNGTPKQEEIRATLLANNNGPVWKIGNDIVTGLKTDTYRFPELPGNLYEHPTLLMTLNNSVVRRQSIEASYLANNLTWNADYVLTVARDDKSADLDGWVTLSNNSGTPFHDAKLQLVAGQLNRIPQVAGLVGGVAREAMMTKAAPQFEQENFSEYHLYSLARRTSVEDKETKQISLLEGSGVPVEKRYVANGQNFYYHTAQTPGAALKEPIMVFYKFKNDEKAGLGIPLPGGNFRVYQKDSKGGVLFIGEDHIDHTPKDEFVDVKIGNAFDVVVERKQTDYKKIADRVYEMEFNITLRNHKDTPITVEVNEPIGGDWEMLSSSYPATKTAAFAAQFNVPVKANGESVLTYRVRVHW